MRVCWYTQWHPCFSTEKASEEPWIPFTTGISTPRWSLKIMVVNMGNSTSNIRNELNQWGFPKSYPKMKHAFFQAVCCNPWGPRISSMIHRCFSSFLEPESTIQFFFGDVWPVWIHSVVPSHLVFCSVGAIGSQLHSWGVLWSLRKMPQLGPFRAILRKLASPHWLKRFYVSLLFNNVCVFWVKQRKSSIWDFPW